MGNPQVIEVDIVSGVALIGEVDVDEAKDQKILPLFLIRKRLTLEGC
ncbi:hypothetical protein [Roseivirga thermotolerans]|nr:hypothetical protein [Roseivirga thermotolerans]